MPESSSIQWKWVLVSLGILLVGQVILSVSLTVFGILTLGFGFVLFIIFKPLVYFLGGLVTGWVSPGITVIEPAVGAFIISVLGILFDNTRFGAGRIVWAAISGVVAFVVALIGASIGERMQGNDA